MASAAVLDQVRSAIREQRLLETGEGVVVGVSGGADSVCLLHVLSCLRTEWDLSLWVAHLNHQLRGADARADAEFVRRLAQGWGVAVMVTSVDVPAVATERKVGLEQAARQERYAFLAQAARQVGATCVAVGHHADDQAETVLMHLLRGAGLSGLGGMRPRAALPDSKEIEGGSVRLIRPLLGVTRDQIEAYCREHGLDHRFDRSNLDPSLFRNRLRHQVLPALERVSPGVSRRLCLLADLAQADEELLDGWVDEAWHRLVQGSSAQAIVMDLPGWRGLPLSLRRRLLRRAVEQMRGSAADIGAAAIEQARRIIEAGGTGARAGLPGGLMAHVSYHHLAIGPAEWLEPVVDLPWLSTGDEVPVAVPGRTLVPGSAWQVAVSLVTADEAKRAAAVANTDPLRAHLDADRLGEAVFLRPRRAGERFQPLGLEGKHSSVADFMIDHRIPAAWRDRVPLLVGRTPAEEHILWLVGWRIDHRCRITQRTRQIACVSFELASRGPERGPMHYQE